MDAELELQLRLFRIVCHQETDENCKKALSVSFARSPSLTLSIFTTIIISPSMLSSSETEEEIKFCLTQRKTILHILALKGFASSIEFLLSKGVDPMGGINREDTESVTPILLACDSGEINTIKVLIKYGAIFDIRCARTFAIIEKDFFEWLIAEAWRETGDIKTSIINGLQICLGEFRDQILYFEGSSELCRKASALSALLESEAYSTEVTGAIAAASSEDI